jgi:hypothetical protein
VFDGALAELVSDMHLSSFRMFKASGMYLKACTELGQLRSVVLVILKSEILRALVFMGLTLIAI